MKGKYLVFICVILFLLMLGFQIYVNHLSDIRKDSLDLIKLKIDIMVIEND